MRDSLPYIDTQARFCRLTLRCSAKHLPVYASQQDVLFEVHTCDIDTSHNLTEHITALSKSEHDYMYLYKGQVSFEQAFRLFTAGTGY